MPFMLMDSLLAVLKYVIMCLIGRQKEITRGEDLSVQSPLSFDLFRATR